jgi:hypothetical protein
MFSSVQEFKQDIVPPSPWNLAAIAGRFVEISASASTASLTLAFGLVREAQNQKEPVGWVTSTGSFFYPPDAAHRGIDLAALAVIRVLHAVSIPRAGEKLLRSGGFGLIVLDLGTADIAAPLQPFNRARPAPPYGPGMPYRKRAQNILAGIARFIAGSCRAATELR